MGHTFCFLTATWLAAQTVDVQAVTYQNVPNQQGNCACQQGNMGGVRQYSSNGSRYMPAQERPGLWGRIRNIFQRQPQGNQQQYYGNQNNQQMPPNMRMVDPRTITSAEPPLADPIPQTPAKGPAMGNLQPAANRPVSPISAKFVNKIGHEEDYSWVTGQLFQENGRWVIRYATPETVDRYNGVLMLATEGALTKVQPGDLVSARGTVVPNARAGMAIYRATSVDVIERNGQ